MQLGTRAYVAAGGIALYFTLKTPKEKPAGVAFGIAHDGVRLRGSF